MVVRELITLLGFDLKDEPLQKYDQEIDSTKEKSEGLAKAAKGIGTAYKLAAAAVRQGVEEAISDAIGGARGTIPYAEAKRNL